MRLRDTWFRERDADDLWRYSSSASVGKTIALERRRPQALHRITAFGKRLRRLAKPYAKVKSDPASARCAASRDDSQSSFSDSDVDSSDFRHRFPNTAFPITLYFNGLAATLARFVPAHLLPLPEGAPR